VSLIQKLVWIIVKKFLFLGPKRIVLLGLLICTLISENQGLEKSSSASNLRNKKKCRSFKPGFFF
jgi:hypothetical protein